MSLPPRSQSEMKASETDEFWKDDALLQTVSTTRKDHSFRSRRNAGSQTSNKLDDSKSIKTFKTIASANLPLRVDERRGLLLVPEQNARISLRFVLPPTAHDGKWSASFGGSSVVRGPIGCATGCVNVGYHFTRTQLFGGMNLGDQSNVSIGGSASSIDKRKLVSLRLTSSPKARLTSLLEARYTKTDLWCASANLSVSSALRSTLGVSFSTLTPHKIHIGLGWRSVNPSLPTMQLKLQPKLSQHQHATMTLGRVSGRWQIAADIAQSLRSKTTALSIGVSHFRRRLLWTFTWHRGDVMIRVPILVTKTTGTLLNYVEMTFLSLLSGALQAVLARAFNINSDSPDADLKDELLLLKQSKGRADAEHQMLLMTRQARNRVKAEQEKNGLVVRYAAYYVEGGDTWDVTTQLQFWTSNASLKLPASSKEHLLGFYDVTASANCSSHQTPPRRGWQWLAQFWRPTSTDLPHVEPTLSVGYEFAGKLYEVAFRDTESLLLPSSKAVPITQTSAMSNSPVSQQ